MRTGCLQRYGSPLYHAIAGTNILLRWKFETGVLGFDKTHPEKGWTELDSSLGGCNPCAYGGDGFLMFSCDLADLEQPLTVRVSHITRQPIPVVPAAHYMCGGVRAGLQGETNVQGLYVAGEVACTGLHGANRLASNSLLEALVFAGRVVQPSIDHMKSSSLDFSASNWWSRPVVPMALERNVINKILTITKEVRKELQSIMWNYVGIVRSTTRLEAAEQKIHDLEAKWEDYLFRLGWEPTMVGLEACEMRNFFCCAKMVVSSALARHESRGLHYTIDFPHVEESERLPAIIFPCSSVKSTWSSR